MGENTGISWCDHTFNPWWGCVKISPGCKNCYAAALDARFGGANWGERNPRRTFGDKHWVQPLRWNARAQERGVRERVFCASMADVFEMPVSYASHDIEDARQRLWSLIERTPWLDWLMLTKRPENFEQLLPWNTYGPWSNVWLGVTAEDQEHAEKRIPILLTASAICKFVSYEPALGPVQLRAEWADGIDWLIAGAESGAGRRPMDEDWVRAMRDQCVARGISFFYKQRIDDGAKVELPLLDGYRWSEIPEVQRV